MPQSEWDAPTVEFADQRLLGRDPRSREGAFTMTRTDAQSRFKEFIRTYRQESQFVLR